MRSPSDARAAQIAAWLAIGTLFVWFVALIGAFARLAERTDNRN
jgi:hypothetical protein